VTTFNPVIQEVWKKAEWLAIATHGADGPHVVGTWGDILRQINGDLTVTIAAPAGKFNKTEQNLKKDPRVEVLLATREVPGARGPGQGCNFIGTAEIQTAGPYAERVKKLFPGIRGALVIHIQSAEAQL